MMRFTLSLIAIGVTAAAAGAQRALPPSQLAIRADGASETFWHANAAPERWTTTPLAARVTWRAVAPGVEAAELTIAGAGEAWRTRVILTRLDPSRLAFSLDTATTRDGRPAWNTARVPASAAFAVNAGQFRSTLPWGLVVLNGRRMLPAERGPLAVTIAIDSAGAVHWIHDGDAMPRGVQWAFQSYPTVLRDRTVPYALRAPDRGVDVAHRDARLALGRLADGSLIVAMTRFDGLGAAFAAVPFGLTTPEMAAIMGSIGAADAVLLDGGISAQIVAGIGDTRQTHAGLRDVPLALVARPLLRSHETRGIK